jgi:hypothetical protein
VVPVVRIGAEVQQGPHENQRAVIDRVLQHDLAEALRSPAVREIRRVPPRQQDSGDTMGHTLR